jgi:transcriptional regulator with XRE-family HTH domain
MDETLNLKSPQRFPWRGRFETKTEIEDYFAGDKVRCLLCGKRFKALPKHLELTHDITADDYRERYGLPWKRGLCGASTSEKMSKNMLKRRKNGFRPPIEAAQKASVRAAKRRPDQPFLVKAKTESLKPIIEKIKKYEDRDFKNVLAKMLREKKGLNEACRDAGMPHFGAVSKYAKKNAGYRKQLEENYAQLPYSVQAGAGRLPEKQFKEDLLSLKRSGITVADMSRLLGVSRSLINNRLKSE